ncbi:hypothetical protein C8F04DRAFT_1231675 [Mycena alexandri]|uniref:Uncharacterized protein n=1 Tax=Mycena alexandri TaxID=1745969 RepID=A0AAD6X4W3_9AGAR|nr:hypothetical protein C8F04DRAFT_1231675 [Mycena alexandri]
MPTATSTMTTTTSAPRKLKATPASAVATLHTLYHRAARAFLLREVPLVHSLLDSAFALLHPPDHPHQQPDELAPYRSKWDLLRITLETTVYASPPTSAGLPDSLRELLAQPPHALITAAYARSLTLFTPRAAPQKASHIPSAIILTLVYSSLKLEAPDAGRVIVEDWLASRNDDIYLFSGDAKEEGSNYRKAVEAYCLYILPKLEQWEYAKEFLDYESELSPDVRENFKASLQTLHAEAVAARLPPKSRPMPIPTSPSLSSPSARPYSPTPSSSSSSSSLSSTTSMHTVVPATPRPRSNLATKPSTTRSSSSASTATPRATPSALPQASPPRLQHQQNQHHLPRLYPNAARSTARTPPSAYELLKASLAPYLTARVKLSAISLATFVLLLVLPLLVRRRRNNNANAGSMSGGVGNAERVRRRLQAASAASGSGVEALGRALGAMRLMYTHSLLTCPAGGQDPL